MLRCRKLYINFASDKNVAFVSSSVSIFNCLSAAIIFVAPGGTIFSRYGLDDVGPMDSVGASTKKTSPY